MTTPEDDLQRRLEAIDDLERAQRQPLPRPFGPYLLVESIAKGGMGEVFLARTGGVAGNTQLVKHCVVKTLRPHLTDDREYVARFLDEARVVVQLSHAGVCQVFDVGMVGERYYLAMELIAGEDLRVVSDTMGPMDRATAVFIVAEILEALDYAHRLTDVRGQPLKLVHRDISPQNIMVSFEGEVKLIDFGLAQSAVKVEKTSPQTVMGKLAYMSPEQLRGETATRVVDLFATAVTLTELLLGERFYEARNSHDTWLLAAKGGHRPKKFFSAIEPGLAAILDQALDQDPRERFEDALSFRAALLGWMREQRLWADRPMLRELMQRRFRPQIEAHRARLQIVEGIQISTPPSQAAPEPSRSIARAPSSEILLGPPKTEAPGTGTTDPQVASTTPTTVTQPGPPLAPTTEVTSAVVAARLGETRGRALRAAALVAAAIALVVVAVIATGERPRDVDARAARTNAGLTTDKARAITAAAAIASSSSSLSSPQPSPPPAEPAPPPAEPAPPPAEPPSPTLAEPPPPPPPDVKAAEPRRPRRTPPPPPPAVVDVAARPSPPPSPPPATPPSPPPSSRPPPPPTTKQASPSWDDLMPAARAAYLAAKCPKLACARELEVTGQNWGKLGAPEMRAFKANLEACRASCGVK